MKRKIIFSLIIAILISLFPNFLVAWGYTWAGAALEQIVNAARWRSGLIRYNAALRILNAGYDSDIYFGSTLERVPDYTFSASSDLQVFVPLKSRIVFEFNEQPQYIFYHDTQRERALNNVFGGRFHVVSDRFYFQAGGGLINAKQRLSTELNLNVRLKQNDLTGLFLWQASKNSSFALNTRTTSFRYENLVSGPYNISENLNRNETYLNLTGYLQQRARNQLFLNLQYGSVVFTEPVAKLRNTKIYAVYGGMEFAPAAEIFSRGSRFRGQINLGFEYFDILTPGIPDFTGLVGNTNIYFSLTPQTALRAFFSRGPQFSVYSDLYFYLQTITGAGFSHFFTRKISFSYDVYYGWDQYKGQTSPGLPPGQKNQYWSHALTLNFRLKKYLDFSILANYGARRYSMALRPESSRSFIGINITYGYPGAISIPGNIAFRR